MDFRVKTLIAHEDYLLLLTELGYKLQERLPVTTVNACQIASSLSLLKSVFKEKSEWLGGGGGWGAITHKPVDALVQKKRVKEL